MKKNTLILDDEEYDLIKIDTPYFIIYENILSMPFVEECINGERRTYKSIQIGTERYSVKPKSEIESLSLNNTILTDRFGWQWGYEKNISIIYYKGFNGNRWFELNFTPLNNDVILRVKRIRKDVVEEQIVFDGTINTIEEFNYICNILNIE